MEIIRTWVMLWQSVGTLERLFKSIHFDDDFRRLIGRAMTILIHIHPNLGCIKEVNLRIAVCPNEYSPIRIQTESKEITKHWLLVCILSATLLKFPERSYINTGYRTQTNIAATIKNGLCVLQRCNQFLSKKSRQMEAERYKHSWNRQRS